MEEIKVLMGKMPKQADEEYKTIELIITEDCNLRCHYCYLVGKNNKRKMGFEVAKKAVDFILIDQSISGTPGVVWSMGGAEAFLEIDLIDKITEYIKNRMMELNHPWHRKHIFHISTNGLLYDSPKVQEYVKNNYGNISIGMTIDGNKEKHDSARVFPDGSGSYDKVLKNAELWFKQFPCMEKITKSTFSHDDLPYLKDSIISLWNIGIQYVMANVVFEDVWQEGDDILFENQLKELADYTLEHELWRNHTVRFFDPHIGFPMTEAELNKCFCGSGKHMLSIDCEGKIYACNRFIGFSLNEKEPLPIGDIYTGIDENRRRPFLSFSIKSISNKECLNCEFNNLCAYCAGHNYDAAETDTIFNKATYICKMHKANVRASQYFWDQFKKVTGLESVRDKVKASRENLNKKNNEGKYLIFILNDAVVPHCRYNSKKDQTEEMSLETFKRGIDYAEENGFVPVFIGDNIGKYVSDTDSVIISSPNISYIGQNHLIVFDEAINNTTVNGETCIILISKNTIENIYTYIQNIRMNFKRINITIKDIPDWGQKECARYKEQLDKVADLVIKDAKDRYYYDINVLTDLIKLKKMNNCDAGEDSFTLAPNGMIYLCPAFYFDQPTNAIGSLENGITIKDKHLLTLEYAPICSACDSYQCNRCKYLNIKSTGEINTPSKMQCIVNHIERNATRRLQYKLQEENMAAFMEVLPEIDYSDPFEKFIIKNANRTEKEEIGV